jgi:hypothetical protein
MVKPHRFVVAFMPENPGAHEDLSPTAITSNFMDSMTIAPSPQKISAHNKNPVIIRQDKASSPHNS